jgi:hypothetical protein
MARGEGGPRELDAYANAQSAGERDEIAAALANLLPDVVDTYLTTDGQRVPTVDVPDHNPKNPEHQRFQSEWTAYHESERHFLNENPDAASRLKNAQLPRPIIMYAIQNRNPQLLYFLSHRKNLQYAHQLAALPAHDLQANLEQLAESLLYDERIPVEERGIVRAGDFSTDRYLQHRNSGRRILEPRKQLPRSRDSMDADDYIAMREGEKREYRKVRGHR